MDAEVPRSSEIGHVTPSFSKNVLSAIGSLRCVSLTYLRGFGQQALMLSG